MANRHTSNQTVQPTTTPLLSSGAILRRQCASYSKPNQTIARETCSDCEQSNDGSLQRLGSGTSSGKTVPPKVPTSSRFQHNFSQVPIRRQDRPSVQTKLMVGSVGDRYEQEAEQVAEQIIRMPDSELMADAQSSAPLGNSAVAADY